MYTNFISFGCIPRLIQMAQVVVWQGLLTTKQSWVKALQYVLKQEVVGGYNNVCLPRDDTI